LAPVPHRGKRNEPAFVALTAERLAELWGVSVTEVQAKTSENTARLFGLPSL
jgi:TatD DNase family protein